jgi:hypothetical protein
MSNGNAPDLVTAILSFMAFVLPLMLIPFAFKFAGSGLHKLYNGVQNGLQNARNRGTGLASKAAKNSSYGQAAQQFMNNRKQIAGLKGREALRNTLNRNPSLAALMGGAGGKKYAARFVDAENRKYRAEEVQNLQQGITANIADAAGKGQNVASLIQRKRWADTIDPMTGTVIKPGRAVSPEDEAAFRKLQQQGYVNPDGTVASNNPILTTASMQSIMGAEIASEKNIKGLAGQLKGASVEDIAMFSEELRKQAATHNYKNFSTATVDSDGRLVQFYNKTGEADPVVDRIKGARSVIKSSLRGVNKDALDPTMDTAFLEGIQSLYTDPSVEGFGANDHTKRTFVVKVADETSHIDKPEVIDAIVSRFGGDIDTSTFQQLQRNIKSGGASSVDKYIKTGSI